MMIVMFAAPALSYGLVVAVCVGLLKWHNRRIITLLALAAALVTLFALGANACDGGALAQI